MPSTKTAERRGSPRVKVRAHVGYDIESGDTFLFEYTDNLSEEGIFLETKRPLEPGTRLNLCFHAPDDRPAINLLGQVSWINEFRPEGENPNPGMGIRFIKISRNDRDRLIHLVNKKAVLADV